MLRKPYVKASAVKGVVISVFRHVKAVAPHAGTAWRIVQDSMAGHRPGQDGDEQQGKSSSFDEHHLSIKFVFLIVTAVYCSLL